MSSYIPLILSGVSLNAVAQLFLKTGMNAVGYFQFSSGNILSVLPRIVLNPFIVLGMVCYLLSIAIWLAVLSRVEVSFAYPFLSVGYVLVACLGYFFFGENLSFNKILGIAIICVGLFFLSRSG